MLTFTSLFSVFIASATEGPVAAIVTCAAMLILGRARAEMRAVLRAEAAGQAKAAQAKAEAAVIAEAEAAVAAARLRLERGAPR